MELVIVIMRQFIRRILRISEKQKHLTTNEIDRFSKQPRKKQSRQIKTKSNSLISVRLELQFEQIVAINGQAQNNAQQQKAQHAQETQGAQELD